MLALDCLNTKSEALCALLLYKVSQGGELKDSIFATRHDLTINKGRPCVSNGRLFKESDLASLLELMAGQDADDALLPENLLGQSNRHLSWFVKGESRKMWFTDKFKLTRDHIELKWPNLLFSVVDNDLYLASYCGSSRPNEGTRLYHAPLMNVYDNTNVCLGSATKPIEHGFDAIKSWEDIIFNTRFSHINNTIPLSIKGDNKKDNSSYLKHIGKVAKSGKAISSSNLVSLNTNLKGYITWLLNK